MTLFTGYNASDIYVIAGDHNIDIADGEEKYNTKQVILHPKYGENDGYHFNYDACLLEVDPISLDGKTTGTVCLPESGAHIEATVDEYGNKVKMKTIFYALNEGLLNFTLKFRIQAVTLPVGVQQNMEDVLLTSSNRSKLIFFLTSIVKSILTTLRISIKSQNFALGAWRAEKDRVTGILEDRWSA